MQSQHIAGTRRVWKGRMVDPDLAGLVKSALLATSQWETSSPHAPERGPSHGDRVHRALHDFSAQPCATLGCSNLAEPRDANCIPCELNGMAWNKPQTRETRVSHEPSPLSPQRFLRPGALKARLAELRLTQAELARDLGVQRPVVSMWVKRHRPVPEQWWPELATALSVGCFETFLEEPHLPEGEATVTPRQLVRVLVGLEDLGYGQPMTSHHVTLQTYTFIPPGMAA